MKRCLNMNINPNNIELMISAVKEEQYPKPI